MDEHASPPPKRLRVIDEEEIGEEAMDETEETYENGDENTPTEAYAYMVYTNEMLEYVDVAKFKDIAENSGAILNGMRYYMEDTLSQAGILPHFMSLLAYILTWKMILSLLLFAFMVYMVRWYVNYKMKNAHLEGYQLAWSEASTEINQNRALAIVWGGMEETQERVREQYRTFRRQRRHLEEADVQRDAAIPVCRRALIEAVEHADMCPFGDLVWEMDGVWHAQPQCADLPAHYPGAPRYGTIGSPVSFLRPGPTCSTGTPTPHFPDRHGLTLLQELENWITDQGTNAWPLTGPYGDAG